MHEDDVVGEIRDLHAFFAGWLGSEPPEEDEGMARLEATLADGFVIVPPDGTPQARGELLDALRRSRGARPGVRLWTEDESVIGVHGDVAVCLYQEWHHDPREDDRPRGRVSTALLRPRDGAPGRLEWLHVHETWLPDGTTPEAAP